MTRAVRAPSPPVESGSELPRCSGPAATAAYIRQAPVRDSVSRRLCFRLGNAKAALRVVPWMRRLSARSAGSDGGAAASNRVCRALCTSAWHAARPRRAICVESSPHGRLMVSTDKASSAQAMGMASHFDPAVSAGKGVAAVLRIAAPLHPLCHRGDMPGHVRPLAIRTADATKCRQVMLRQPS